MTQDNRRFAIILILISLLIFGGMGVYFKYFAHDVTMPNLANLQKRPDMDALDAAQKASSETDLTPPSTKPKPSELTDGKPKVTELPSTHIGTDGIHSTYPAARVAPDMFPFQSIPFDAPLAEFPLVLVGQKNLELYKVPRTPGDGGMPEGPGSSIYGRPSGRPVPPTPPGPPGPPGPPTPPIPPTPPVSRSGL